MLECWAQKICGLCERRDYLIELYSSKLGRAISIPNPYVRWLCEHHHTLKESPANPDLQRLQSADVRTARYARLLHHPTRRRKMLHVDVPQLARELEHAAQRSVYPLYSAIYHSDTLNNITASKAHPTETLCNHLLGVANWVLYLGRMQTSSSRATSVALVGESGGTPGPVEMEDPWDEDEP